MSEWPERLIDVLKQRGWTADEIADMPPDKAFEEYCNWYGLTNWGRDLIDIYRSINQSLPLRTTTSV